MVDRSSRLTLPTQAMVIIMCKCSSVQCIFFCFICQTSNHIFLTVTYTLPTAEHANSTRDQEPSRCEVTVLTTVPLCRLHRCAQQLQCHIFIRPICFGFYQLRFDWHSFNCLFVVPVIVKCFGIAAAHCLSWWTDSYCRSPRVKSSLRHWGEPTTQLLILDIIQDQQC